MMKNIYKYLTLAFAVLASSCYDDDSSLDINPIPELSIEIEGVDKTILTSMLDSLILTPEILVNGKESNKEFIYEWALNQVTSEFQYPDDFEVISSDKNLKYAVVRPIDDAKDYILMYRVTDPSTDFTYSKIWNLKVSSSFGEGILVAYKDEDGKSELGLIMDKEISYLYTKPASVRTGIYKGANGEELTKEITSITYTNQMRAAITWVTLSDGNYVCLDNKTYLPKNVDMIYRPDSFFAKKFYATHQYMTTYSNDGMYVTHKTNGDRPGVATYKITADKERPSGDVVASYSHDQGAQPHAVWFNEKDGAFYGLNLSWNAAWTSAGKLSVNGASNVFDRTNLPNKEAKAGSIAYDGASYSFLLKDKTTGEYTIYCFGLDVYNGSTWDAGVAKIASKLPASANTILNEAIDFIFMNDYAVMYVVTKDKVYSVNYSSANAVFNQAPQFTAPSDETINVAKLYQQGTFVDKCNIFAYDQLGMHIYNNRAVCLATNNQGEGSIYIIPMVTSQASNGVLDVKKQVKYEGFGEIIDFVGQGITSY